MVSLQLGIFIQSIVPELKRPWNHNTFDNTGMTVLLLSYIGYLRQKH